MSRRNLRPLPRATLLALALAAVTLPAIAQNVGSGTRFTPVLGDATTLYPRSLTTTDSAPHVATGQGGLDNSVIATLDRVSVQVDRDGVPADGQTPVHIIVQLLGAD